jgi:hypothetical protein
VDSEESRGDHKGEFGEDTKSEHTRLKQKTHSIIPPLLRTQRHNTNGFFWLGSKWIPPRDQNAQERSPLSNMNKNIEIFKMGENDMPFYTNLQVGIFA